MFGMFMSSFFVCVSESDSQALSNGNGMPVAMKGHETHIMKQMGLLNLKIQVLQSWKRVKDRSYIHHKQIHIDG